MLSLGFILVFACFTVSLQLPAPSLENEDEEESRVFRGRLANQGEFPWMVNLEIKHPDGKHVGLCGGFLISKTHVMTAAHCVCKNATTKLYANVKDITGRIGHVNRADATQVKFDKLHVHEGYDKDYNKDIAILKLEKTVKFDNNVKSICIADKGKTYKDRQAVVQMGWGRFDNVSRVATPTLKTTSLGYILHEQSCIDEMDSYAEPGQLCVSNLSGEKICSGDSGGPMCLINGNDKVAIGIVSFDYYDFCVDDNQFPAMYTDIGYYSTWVKDKTKDNDICWKK